MLFVPLFHIINQSISKASHCQQKHLLPQWNYVDCYHCHLNSHSHHIPHFRVIWKENIEAVFDWTHGHDRPSPYCNSPTTVLASICCSKKKNFLSCQNTGDTHKLCYPWIRVSLTFSHAVVAFQMAPFMLKLIHLLHLGNSSCNHSPSRCDLQDQNTLVKWLEGCKLRWQFNSKHITLLVQWTVI
jgi:hypothetical protein